MTTIAIIGAGLAGLTAAKRLGSNPGIYVRIFEKSGRAGGRMSSRHREYHFDHGAQYFTARSDAFQSFLAPYLHSGVVARWDARFIELDRDTPVSRRRWDSGHPHYIAVPDMNSLCRAFAAELDVHYRTRVASIRARGSRWELRTDTNTSLGVFDRVVTAIPAQQSAAIMPDCFSHIEELRQKKMQACYTLMLGFEQSLDLDFDCALVHNADVSWISVNSSKPGRPPGFALVIHSSNPWAESTKRWDHAKVKIHLVREASDVLKQDLTKARHIDLHRWLYANIAPQTGEPALVDNRNRLAAIGDWCIQGRVESAFASGSALASAHPLSE